MVNVNVVRGNVNHLNHSQMCFYRLGRRDLPVLGPSAPSVREVSLLDLCSQTQDERFMGEPSRITAIQEGSQHPL